MTSSYYRLFSFWIVWSSTIFWD